MNGAGCGIEPEDPGFGDEGYWVSRCIRDMREIAHILSSGTKRRIWPDSSLRSE